MLGMQEAQVDDDSGDAIVVHMKDAERLPAADMALSGGRSDPYAVLGVGTGATRRTRTVMRTLRPTWDKELTFNNIEQADSTMLNIDIYDWDRCRVDERLGFVAINFAPLSYDTTYHFELKLQADPGCVLREEDEDEEDEGRDEADVAEAKEGCRPPTATGSGVRGKEGESPLPPQGTPLSEQLAASRDCAAAEAAETKGVASDEALSGRPLLAEDRPAGAFARDRVRRRLKRKVRVRREKLTAGREGEEKEGLRARAGLATRSAAPGRAAGAGGSPTRRRSSAGGTARNPPAGLPPVQLAGRKRLFSERAVCRSAHVTPPVAAGREVGEAEHPCPPPPPTPPASSANAAPEKASTPGRGLAPGGGIVQAPDQGIVRFSVTKHMSTARRLKLRRTDPAALEGLDRLVSLIHRASLTYRHTEGMVATRRARRKAKWAALHHTRVVNAALSLGRSVSAGLRTATSWPGRGRGPRTGGQDSSRAVVHPVGAAAHAGYCTAGAAADSRDDTGRAEGASSRHYATKRQQPAEGTVPSRDPPQSWRLVAGLHMQTGSALMPFTEGNSEGETSSDASASTYDEDQALTSGELVAFAQHTDMNLETLDELSGDAAGGE